MLSEDIRTFHEAALQRLSGLVSERDKSLRLLEITARVATGITPATGMVIEFDIASARNLVDAIYELTPKIAAQMVELNGYARQLGKPDIIWQAIDIRDA